MGQGILFSVAFSIRKRVTSLEGRVKILEGEKS
jgi:hypothetical protein